jgi:hypothetical protein
MSIDGHIEEHDSHDEIESKLKKSNKGVIEK